jgi:N-acetylglucosaminyldiphosphoundecaprenol N-acetyl-beta-D-mannosaminyltransferase
MKVNLLGMPIDALTMAETIDLIDEAICLKKRISHVVINAAKVISMKSDKQLFESVRSCDLINADGQSIIWAARFLGRYLPERVTGIDLMQKLVNLAAQRKYKCFFLGAVEEVVKKVVEIYSTKYGKEIIAGYNNGYFIQEEEEEISNKISNSQPQLLFVAMTSPRKENFLYKYRDNFSKINFTMGVGGSFDVIAGVTKRAPLFMQKYGLEWLYRLLQEPRRMWRRYLIGNFIFIWYILKEKFCRRDSDLKN